MSKAYNYPRQGELWLINTDKIKEFSKDQRPFLIISNNLKNEVSSKVIGVTLTTDFVEQVGEYEFYIAKDATNGLRYNSKILADSIFTLDKSLRLDYKLGQVDDNTLMIILNKLNSVLSTEY